MTGAEQGAAMVMLVLWLPLLLLLVVFVVDVGNWFTHRRHLQTQADAAALAGAGEFRYPCDGTVNTAIETTARLYSGESDIGYNQQVGGRGSEFVHAELNSPYWYEQDDFVDDTVVEGPPCDSGMVDVKMTETELPLFLQVADLFTDVDYVNTQARVEIFQRENVSGALPVGVPDNNPKVGRVIFIDEVTGQELGSRELKRNGNKDELAIWDNTEDPFPLTVNTNRIGVRVAFGGATSTTCGDPLVECYDALAPGTGILHVRGYSTAGDGSQPGAPLARNVFLTPGICVLPDGQSFGLSDPYFFDTDGTCSIGVQAEVDFGPCDGLSEIGAKVEARRVGSNIWYPLALASCPSGSSTSTWETTGDPIAIAPDEGPVPIELRWGETSGKQGGEDCTAGGGNKCKGSFGVVQRSFSASDDRSGPIRLAQLWEGGSGWANSLERCSEVQSACTYNVVAKIGVDRNQEENAKSVNDPLVSLRFGASSGSQNQALDCDPNPTGDPPDNSLRNEIAYGCSPAYTENEGAACPATPNELWSSAAPWDCVALETGDKTGQIWQGMNLRVHGSSDPIACESPNNWAEFEDPGLDPADPRIVPVFITPFGTFTGSGSGTVPVTGFATFYATGWHGSQATCPTDDLAPSKSIVGHFIKYVQAFNDGGASDELCDFNELGSCIAVMTR